MKGGKHPECGFILELQPQDLVELDLGIVSASWDFHQGKRKLVERCHVARPKAQRRFVLGDRLVQMARRPLPLKACPDQSPLTA